jgi:hypothetical protein
MRSPKGKDNNIGAYFGTIQSLITFVFCDGPINDAQHQRKIKKFKVPTTN